MTLEEAIDSNVELKGELVREGRLEKADGVQLGIEALRSKLENRRYGVASSAILLPSETKE